MNSTFWRVMGILAFLVQIGLLVSPALPRQETHVFACAFMAMAWVALVGADILNKLE